MRKFFIVLFVVLAMGIVPGTGIAGFSIPLDISNPPRFNPKNLGAQRLSENECNSRLEKGANCNRMDYCADRGPAMIEFFSKNRKRMYNLIRATSSGRVVFVRLTTKGRNPKDVINEFRASEVDTRSDQEYFNGAYGRAPILGYFPMKKSALVLMRREDYMAERHARNQDTVNKFMQRADRDTQMVIERIWYPAIRDMDKRIEFHQRMLFMCCGYDYAHGGWPSIDSNGWTQQEIMDLHSGRRSTRKAVYRDNQRLFEKGQGKRRVDTEKVVPPTGTSKPGTPPKPPEPYKNPYNPGKGSGKAGSGGLGGGGDTIFGVEGPNVTPTPPPHLTPKK